MTSLPVQLNSIPGYEGVRKDDLLIPRIRIVQKMSNLPGNPPEGKIFNTTSQEIFDEIRCAVVGIKHTQVFWENIEDERPACSSDDGEVPRSNIENPVSKYCANCPKKRWTRSADGKHVPPQCSDRITMMVINRSDMSPIIVDFYRTSYSIGRAIITTLMSKKKPPYSTPIILNVRQQTSSRFNFYTWGFVPDKPYEEGEEEEMRQLFEFYHDKLGEQLVAESQSARERGDKEEYNNQGVDDVMDIASVGKDEVPW